MTHLADYSLPQLKQLQTRISKEIEKRASNTKASLLKRLRKLAQEEGISLEDLLGRDTEATASATKRGRPTAKTVSAKKEPLAASTATPTISNNRGLGVAASRAGSKHGWRMAAPSLPWSTPRAWRRRDAVVRSP